jgi:hypothetical protein
VEEKMVDFELASLKELHEALAERLGLVDTSTCNITEASQQMGKLILKYKGVYRI